MRPGSAWLGFPGFRLRCPRRRRRGMLLRAAWRRRRGTLLRAARRRWRGTLLRAARRRRARRLTHRRRRRCRRGRRRAISLLLILWLLRARGLLDRCGCGRRPVDRRGGRAGVGGGWVPLRSNGAAAPQAPER